MGDTEKTKKLTAEDAKVAEKTFSRKLPINIF